MARKKYKEMDSQNKRRATLGIHVNVFENGRDSFFSGDNTWYIRGTSFSPYADKLCSFVGDDILLRADRWKMLRRARAFLLRRQLSPDSDYLPPLYRKQNKISTALDCFPALRYSYSSPLPGHVLAKKHGVSLPQNSSSPCYLDCCYNPDHATKKARFNDLSRSGSIRLDPVDAMRQLFLYRIRIQRCISWGYAVGLVPLMMTVTIFHRWHPLRGLLRVLSKAWNHFFNASTAAVKRSKRMGLVGYIRRSEETINNGSRDEGYNSGWHPHYHVILFVPADKVSVVSSMEGELREAWFYSVNLFFEKEFGEKIDPSYEKSFLKHGLYFSKVQKGGQGFKVGGSIDLSSFSTYKPSTSDSDCDDTLEPSAKRAVGGEDLSFVSKSGTPPSRARAAAIDDTTSTALPKSVIDTSDGLEELRHVDDSEYMAKVFGCASPALYCGDTELTSGAKGSRVPFDLLLEDTAENNDLWVEYALATKGVRCFVFSHGLEKRVREYFNEHPDRDPIPKFTKSNVVIAQISTVVYKIVEKNFKLDEMLRVAVKGYDALCDWFRKFYHELGLPDSAITDDKLPLPPNSRTVFGGIVHATPSASILQEVMKESKTSSTPAATTAATSTLTDSSSASQAAPPSRKRKKRASERAPWTLPFDFKDDSSTPAATTAAANTTTDSSSGATPPTTDAGVHGALVRMRITESVLHPARAPKSLFEEPEPPMMLHPPYPEDNPEDPLYYPPVSPEETEAMCSKYAYLLEQDPSDTRSRREFLESLQFTYRDMDKFKEAIPLEHFYYFWGYIYLQIQQEKELEEREKEWEKEWERVLPELEAQSKKDMAEADAYFARLRAEAASTEDDPPAPSAEEPDTAAPQEEVVVDATEPARTDPSEASAEPEESVIRFDLEDNSSEMSDYERLLAMIQDPNSILARAIEVSRSRNYPEWYRIRMNNMARDVIREHTSLDPDSRLMMRLAAESPESDESTFDFLFIDDDPAVRSKEKYSDETSLESRMAEVFNSQWYPDWYRKRLRNQMRASQNVANRSSDNSAPTKSAREIEEDKRLLDIFLKEAANLPSEPQPAPQTPVDRLFANLGEGLTKFREAAMKRNANVTLTHGKKRGD